MMFAVTIAAWAFISRQPPQVSADLLQGLLIGAMTVSGLSMIGELIADLRGQDAMGMLGRPGHGSRPCSPASCACSWRPAS